MYTVTITFTEPLLGTAPLDKEVYSTYIAEKRVENGESFPHDEVDTIQEDKGKTGFHRNAEGNPILYDYVIKGFFKDTCGMLTRVDGTQSKKIKAYRKIIDGLVFIFPRQIPLVLAGDITTLERPLRAATAQGERVALAHSEQIAVGSSLTFTLDILDGKVIPLELLEEWFNYGKYRGLGQWRNASYGRFTYTLS
jgi:hypothetical protein